MTTRAKIVETARSWAGVQYRKQGRTREGGIDCLGLPRVVATELGMPAYDLVGYDAIATDTQMLDHLRAAGCTRINPLSARDGDIVVFRQNNRYPGHLGILTTKHNVRHVIHASSSLGHRKVVEEPMPDDRGSPGAPIVATFVMPGVED